MLVLATKPEVIGKDIMRFYCIYWPALLMAQLRCEYEYHGGKAAWLLRAAFTCASLRGDVGCKILSYDLTLSTGR